MGSAREGGEGVGEVEQGGDVDFAFGAVLEAEVEAVSAEGAGLDDVLQHGAPPGGRCSCRRVVGVIPQDAHPEEALSLASPSRRIALPRRDSLPIK